MDEQHGSRWIPIIWGIVYLVGAFLISGVGKGIVHIITLFIGGGLLVMGIRSLYMGLFAKQDTVDQMTLRRKGR